MKIPPALSDTEWEVMNVIWEWHPVAAIDIIEALPKRSTQTVKTLLNRLLHKKALRYEAEGKRYLYRPGVTRERCLRHASKSFIAHVFSGDPGSLVSHLIEHHRLNAADLAALQDQIDRQREHDKKQGQ